MKPSDIKYFLIVFGVGMMLSYQIKAQQLSGLPTSKQSTLHSLWPVTPSSTIFNAHSFSQDSSVYIMSINGPITPKDAIFCQFENRLWKSFDIGIRLRVETPPPLH